MFRWSNELCLILFFVLIECDMMLELEIAAGVKSQGGGRRKENPTEPSVMR